MKKENVKGVLTKKPTCLPHPKPFTTSDLHRHRNIVKELLLRNHYENKSVPASIRLIIDTLKKI